MLMTLPNSSDFDRYSEGDIIAITKNSKFIGYASVYSKLLNNVILDVDKNIWKLFNELVLECIPFDFNLD
ncbi:hypothetical protein [Pseudobacteroides cellulosolvens]|uniref:HIRAN domain-containing protein n=1 Tax=Pseudobacteroides cellulosolvens ATCC 35603 = DSM 2933 TaxID=398512 RepID=A0A0L6JSH3_9FIRM|nr:hypothetical protein [Pseudobacteroides cellulosolvens]KNY28659.1 hypothetical protein Bccel_3933 [Pseudobacteroides cellulosolvens ATCC 35603 = DSM 2933]